MRKCCEYLDFEKNIFFVSIALFYLFSLITLSSCQLNSQIFGDFDSSSSDSVPTVSINAPSSSSGDSTTDFSFVVIITGASNINLTSSDITLNDGGGGPCDNPAITNGATSSPTVTISNCVGDGSIGITVNANVFSNLVGERNLASSPSATAMVSNSISCPTGGAEGEYILVPGNTSYGTREFCVMKYEAKAEKDSGVGSGSIQDWGCDTDADPSNGGDASCSGVSADWVASLAPTEQYTPVAKVAGRPWRNISRNEALAECQSLGAGYDLITNDEWQTIARNIELVHGNWSENKVGGVSAGNGGTDSNELNRGHADDAPNEPLSANANDVLGCDGTGQTCNGGTLGDWSLEKRTHKLSNGEVIWDLAGNIWEWVKDDYINASAYGANSNISQVTSATHTNLFPLKGGTTTTARKAKDQFGPLGDYTSLSVGGLGYGFLNFNASTVVRGGLFNNLTTSGIFAVDLGIGPTTSSYGLGFRCVMHPKPFDTDFVDVTNATKSLSYTSNQLTASLISSSISASVAGDGSPVIIKNNINVGASTTIAPGDRVQIRLMSSSTDGSKVSAVLTANGKNFKYSVTTSEVSAFSCPTNYIRVPADSDYGTNDFCVMKYEAKLMYDSDGDGDFSNASIVADGNASNTYNYDTDYETPASLVKYKAVSEVSGKPWVYIRRGENGSATGQGALEACQRLNVQEGVTNKYDLITNSEWQIVARNIADQQSGATNNWGTDSYGHTVLNHGHADASPGSTCDAAQEYVDLNCSNSGGETDYEDKRTHNLSNSEVIWDFAGNAWEYVKENHTTTVYLGAASSDEWSVVLDGNADGLSDNYLPAQKDFGPIDLTPSVCTNPSANNKCGLGNIYDHTAGAIVRGNYALGGPGSGVFALYLNIGPTASNTYIGFRCVYHP